MDTVHLIRPFFCVLAISSIFANAQGRLSDKDIEHLMDNVKDDVKSFRPNFNSAISKSSIRKTSREKDAKKWSPAWRKKPRPCGTHSAKTKQAAAMWSRPHSRSMIWSTACASIPKPLRNRKRFAARSRKCPWLSTCPSPSVVAPAQSARPPCPAEFHARRE